MLGRNTELPNVPLSRFTPRTRVVRWRRSAGHTTSVDIPVRGGTMPTSGHTRNNKQPRTDTYKDIHDFLLGDMTVLVLVHDVNRLLTSSDGNKHPSWCFELCHQLREHRCRCRSHMAMCTGITAVEFRLIALP